jgi:hypothetical protein
MRVREYRSFASIESGYSTRAGEPEWNNKLEIEASSSVFSDEPECISQLIHGPEFERMSNLVDLPQFFHCS